MFFEEFDLILMAFYVFSTGTMKVSIDFGASTIDVVCWDISGTGSQKEVPFILRSFECFPHFNSKSLQDLLRAMDIKFRQVEKIFVTGGTSHFFPKYIQKVPIIKVSEIEAIGRGGYFLLQQSTLPFSRKKAGRFLVVSMGTGTCMVQVFQNQAKTARSKKTALVTKHVGGTGVGGGTFLGLAWALLKETDPQKLQKMFQRGDKRKVDLSVKDIVGSGIGIVPASATASNFGKLIREIDFSKADVAAGIINLIGQTIGITATFAARSQRCNFVLLTGKLTRMEQIVDVVKHTGKLYKVPMFVPKHADFVSALGALRF